MNLEELSIKVLLVDDQEVVREAFGTLLAQVPSVEMVGTLGGGEDALTMVPVLKPDVVVMDVKMPGMDGITASRHLREAHPEVGIILLSAYDDAEFIREFLKDSPKGKAYLLKHTLATMDELVRTIHDVAAGRTVLDPIMVEKLTSARGLAENSPIRDLTKREMEVLALMAKACTNSTIASILYIQPRTVEHHINSIFSKLGIAPESGQHARVQAVLAYLKATGQARHQEASLVSPEPS
jgi:DNA-binding NarL/FixJ family response regulator